MQPTKRLTSLVSLELRSRLMEFPIPSSLELCIFRRGYVMTKVNIIIPITTPKEKMATPNNMSITLDTPSEIVIKISNSSLLAKPCTMPIPNMWIWS